MNTVRAAPARVMPPEAVVRGELGILTEVAS